MSDLHLFCSRLSEAQTEELDSIRNSYRKDNTPIPLIQLASDTRQYFEKHLSDANKKNLGDKIFDNYPNLDKLTPEYIVAFEDEINMNVIRRNPRATLVVATLTAAISFIGPLLGIFIFEVVSHTAFLTLLPFLAGLGPVGAALAVAAVFMVGMMAIYGLIIGITAAATNKNIKVEETFSLSQQMDPLHSTPAHSHAHHADQVPAKHHPTRQQGFHTEPVEQGTGDSLDLPNKDANTQMTRH